MRSILPVGVVLLAGALTASASVDSGLLALAPPGAQLIVGIDVQKTRDSEFGQFMLSKSQADDLHMQEFIDKTAFDPRRDLQTVLMVALGKGAPGNSPSSFAVLARGNFDPAKIAAASKNGVTQIFGGVAMTVFKEKRQTVALSFPQPGVAVMADLATMQQIIGSLAAPTSLDADLLAQINTVGNAYDAWFVSTTGPAAWNASVMGGSGGNVHPQAQALESIRSASGGMRSGTTVDVALDATARSAQDATSLADVFRFMASAVQMQRQKDPRAALLATAIDNMQLTTSGSTVHVSFSIPEKSLEQMADLRTQMKPNGKLH